MSRSTRSTPVRTIPVSPMAPVDVAVSIRGVVYPLAVAHGDWQHYGYEAVVATDTRMFMDRNRPHGGYVVATLTPVHDRACHFVTKRWDRKLKARTHGECDCGASQALRELVARGRV